MSTDQDKAYQWISPIMHLGDKLFVETVESLPADAEKSAPILKALEQALNDEEKTIYFCETFSAQCNMSGLSNFFNDSIALFYYEVVAALDTIGASKMSHHLQRCKDLIFGEDDVPIDDEEELESYLDSERSDWEDIEEQLDEIEEECDEIKDAFEQLLTDYTLKCAEEGLLVKR